MFPIAEGFPPPALSRGGQITVPLWRGLGGGGFFLPCHLIILPDLLHGIQGFHLLVDDVGMEYPEPFCLFFLFQYPGELLFEIEVEEFTGGLVVGAIGDLLVSLQFIHGLVFIRKGDAFCGDDVFLF
ncbi:hypothetical protein [Candidatus Brocadia sinica]|uniref:hypothetical protein n=1 Tax=Candidatus Brocadia sinica TaxID=795830 RepID=UPI001E330C9E|nr:hypothetical protein [Candidatus Brocadia sinica]